MYLNARYYDPTLGLFLQPDWFEVTKQGVGTNRYAYNANDPINQMDPSGSLSTKVGLQLTSHKEGTLAGLYSDNSVVSQDHFTSRGMSEFRARSLFDWIGRFEGSAYYSKSNNEYVLVAPDTDMSVESWAQNLLQSLGLSTEYAAASRAAISL